MGSSPQSCKFSLIDYPIPEPWMASNTDCQQSAKLLSSPPRLCSTPSPSMCVCGHDGRRGFGVKGLRWSRECGKPPLVRSNHSRLSIILPPSLPPSDPSQPITPQSCLSPPFHYSHLTGQKIRVTLGGPLSSPTSLSLHLPSFSFSPITPSSLVGIWRVTLGQFNLSSPSASQPPVYGHTPPAGCHSVFYTSHLLCPPLLHRTFYFLIRHSCFPFTCLFF